ncbi:MAG: Zn-dependent hydrolase [Bacteroidetes Order II. Incertae sedis bacterium]|nr:Zn-dependent hydrolase [Bacteroidetes Order II. bacterium]
MAFVFVLVLGLSACSQKQKPLTRSGTAAGTVLKVENGQSTTTPMYVPYRLTSDLVEGLSTKNKQVVGLLIEAAQVMDDIFWEQTYGDPRNLSQYTDPAVQAYIRVNYGPWDFLHANTPFIPGVGPKPDGANYYPKDMSKAEFEAAAATNPALKDPYTMVRRDANGKLTALPFNTYFKPQMERAAAKLRAAAALAEDMGLRKYLELRAEALLTNQYQASDFAWMDMKTSPIDVVIGPIETYEDGLFGYKAGAEAYVLLKDLAWSERLSRYAALLPMLQRGLPVPDAYKAEMPGTDSDLNAYDVVFVTGDANSGSKTIAINLPNDEEVQLKKGTRRLQLKNAMKAKFDKMMLPISDLLVAPDQRKHVTFDAFFATTMFHEVAHGLGIKNTLNGKGTVRGALKEQASWLEEGKADILGLYMIQKMVETGELKNVDLKDYYVTFCASIFRSIRFGTGSAHGKANLVRFNYFQERGVFTRDAVTGTYRVDFEKLRAAVDSLSDLILRLQGDGQYDAVVALWNEKGRVGEMLKADLNRLAEAKIPVDIVFEQGKSILGL